MSVKSIITGCVLLASVFAAGQEAGYRATYYVDGSVEKEQYRSHTTLECLERDASVIYATGGVDLILTKLKLNKTSGSLNDPDRRENGRNSAVLIDGGSKVIIEYCELNSHTAQSDGLTVKGWGSKADVVEGIFNTSRGESAAMNAVDGGKITVKHPKIGTFSNQSPVFYTGLDGELTISEAEGESAGQGSPLFYSSGVINAEKCRMTSSKWTIANVDGGRMTLTKNVINAGGFCGFLVYGNKHPEETGKLELINNSISVAEGPLFYVSNTTSNTSITVSGNKISLKSHELMTVAADDWGVKGSNGGFVTLTVRKQALSGNITVDSISTAIIELQKGGKLNGQINADENRCARTQVVMGEGSTWTSKGDSYITAIHFEAPLAKGLKQLKGKHTIYYDPSDPVNSYLEGKEYKTGGGKLCPIK